MLKEKYQRIYDLYLSDPFLKIDEVCNQFNVCKSSFYRALKKEKINCPQKTYSTTCSKEKLDLALNMYESGESIRKISQDLQMGEKTLSKFLHNKKIEIRFNYKKDKNLYYNENFFEHIDTEEKAYWLGFIYADGSIYKTSKANKLTIELSNVDKNHLVKFSTSLESNLKIKYRSNRSTCSITVCCKKMVNDLSVYGVIQNKTEKGFINLEKIPNNLYKDFIRGYIDGDGYIDKKRHRIVITIKSYLIAIKLQMMLFEIGLNYKIKQDNSYFRLYIENKNQFFRSLYLIYKESHIYLDRKKLITDLRLAQFQ